MKLCKRCPACGNEISLFRIFVCNAKKFHCPRCGSKLKLKGGMRSLILLAGIPYFLPYPETKGYLGLSVYVMVFSICVLFAWLFLFNFICEIELRNED